MGAAIVQGVARAGTAAYSAIQNVSPETKAKVMDYISRATGGRIAAPADVKSFATGTKEGMAVTVQAAVRSGINPDAIFTSQVMNQLRDEQLVKFAAEMRAEFNNTYSKLDATSQLTGKSDAQEGIELSAVAWAARVFGGSNGQIQEAHAMLRLFTSISEAELGQILVKRRLYRQITGG